MYGGNENQELHALYQFGQPESPNNRINADAEPIAPVSNSGWGSGNHNNEEQESYSPQETQEHGMPTSPAAFGTANDTYVPTGNGNGGSYATTVEAAGGKHHHKEGSKKNVIKLVLGKDKKSTKGMSEDEKKSAKLQERWNNAMLEEQRLNELENRVAQEETMTTDLGVAPNFPPKFLCIRPLVFHKISAVSEDRRLFVTMAFWDWVAVCIILIANCPITIACNFAKTKEGVTINRDINKGLNTVLACVYLIGIPLSFLCWYWPIYQGNFRHRPPTHVLALCGLLVALAQAIFAFIGPHSYGFCGVLSSKWVGEVHVTGAVVPMAIVTALWGAQIIFTCFMVVKVFIYYRKDLAARRAERRAQNLAGK